MDFGLTDANQMYMVSEFVHGSTLAERVKSLGPLSINEFRTIFIQICQGMKHAHDAGIVHRDLKPENIIVVNEVDGLVVKIVDFGLAKFLDLDASLTRTGTSMGSPYYMSPEQVVAGEIDHRADIYSLGCVMFFCLEGRPPFKGAHCAGNDANAQRKPLPVLDPARRRYRTRCHYQFYDYWLHRKVSTK